MPKKSLNKMKGQKYAVIIILLKGSQTLLERRLPQSALGNHFLFPGGGIEEDEIADPVIALKREAMEELGIIPVDFFPISTFTGELGTLLKPFVVTGWEGEVPDKILDRGNPVFWQDLEIVAKSPLPSVQQIAKEAKKFLSNNL